MTTAEMARLIRGGSDAGAAADPSAAPRTAESRPSLPESRRLVEPRTVGQRRYWDALQNEAVVFGVGPAGTGKTYLAMAAAIEAVRRGNARRIVLVRPAVEAGEKLGFLPGDFQAKVDPYLRPLYDALHDLLDQGARHRYLENDVIEVCPLAYMRGRTLNDAFVILDEAQNTTVPQMLMFLTRLGENSRMVVTGDPGQVDLPSSVPSGLADALRRLAGVAGVVQIHLGAEDIVRHPVVQQILEAYGKVPPIHRDAEPPAKG
ncbi:MAG: PhoH family protein [Planctomycetes bacterium]|nr:PhoH family protein [Planctomycetota bacterium]